MNRLTAVGVFGILLLAAAIVAVWASIAEAPWEESSTAVEAVTATPPSPAFTEEEVLSLATRMVAAREAAETKCVSAHYRPQNQLWVVACNLTGEPPWWVEGGGGRSWTMTFTFDDQTGQLGD